MLREIIRLRAQAALVEADLARTLGGEWACTVSDDFVLRVVGASWEGVVELDRAVDEDEDDPEATLDDEACAAVAEQVSELVGNTPLAWPACPTCGEPLAVRRSRWTCEEDDLDVAAVGGLPPA